MAKTLKEVGTEGNTFNLIKEIYGKSPKVYIIVSGDRLNAFLLRSEKRQRCLLSPLLFNILVLEALAKAIRQEKEIKSTSTEKEEVKVLQFAGDIIL